ncbi:hypothetical protein FISHEDRAFT_68306 [Fistulina hepatica ATCC 64428]|uniref:Tyrosine specific protein phosphatases domain-containing protein n=1 Tax=Fistulina hepatica ATCC 64428 TaxID=1128425 RepID=A0A0D6ZZ22_9AGAR|nr:hypothetical protein FISHEDRAFT_68306 [Fistulina hepatica ATCC 64428]
MCADTAGWYRFTEGAVFIPQGHRLYRSSTPNYDESKGDASQQQAVDFLSSKGIDSIISYNENIAYLWLPAVGFYAPTIEQFRETVAFMGMYRSTLVHCEYGHGRTGTGVTAIQLAATKGVSPPESQWVSVNHVERHSQMEALRRWRNLCEG